MRKTRLWIAVALVAILCVALPSAALAKGKGSVSFNNIKGSYKVASGKSVTITGRVHGAPPAIKWSWHAPVIVQKKVKGVYKDVLVLALDGRGNFKFTLASPPRGDYRVYYPGCKHFRAGSKHFDIRKGTDDAVFGPSVKLDPMLSIRDMGVGFWNTSGGVTTRKLQGSYIPSALIFSVNTSQSPEVMIDPKLNYTVYASISGATYTPIYVFPSPLSFNGKTNITIMGVLPAVMLPANVLPFYNYIKVEATWGGNRYTAPGAANGVIHRID
jgi:hypothetical protein